MLKSLGSAGGTDILSVALLKRFSLGLGNTALAFNCLVLLAGGLATSPHGNGLCRLLGFGSTWEWHRFPASIIELWHRCRIVTGAKKQSNEGATLFGIRVNLSCYLNIATGKFAGYARHRSCRRINILQDYGNKADSMELLVPKGSKYEKIMFIECELSNMHHECNLLFFNVKLFSCFACARFRCYAENYFQ